MHSFPPATPTPRGCTQLPLLSIDCIVYLRTGEATRDNSTVYDFYALSARWTVHAKIRQLSDLNIFTKSLVKPQSLQSCCLSCVDVWFLSFYCADWWLKSLELYRILMFVFLIAVVQAFVEWTHICPENLFHCLFLAAALSLSPPDFICVDYSSLLCLLTFPANFFVPYVDIWAKICEQRFSNL